jgi:hypothetical protein
MNSDTIIDKNTHITVLPLGVMGYGNADSSISRTKQLKSGELGVDVDRRSQEIINSGKLLVAVNEKDDGCIDGRETVELYVSSSDSIQLKPADDIHNHERAKVAGGGYITGQAIRLGLGMKGSSIDDDLVLLGEDFSSKAIYCGAHTGAHKQGDGTDCGANDKFSLILQNAITFKDQVEVSVKAIIETAGLTFDKAIFDAVLLQWQAVLNDEIYFGKSTGASRLQSIFTVQSKAGKKDSDKPLAVTKHLNGDHNEDYIIINFIKDRTVSQALLAQTLRVDFPSLSDKNLAQVFVVDAWRIIELAKAIAESDNFETALYSGVIYQVATAATLTDGSLPLFAYK